MIKKVYEHGASNWHPEQDTWRRCGHHAGMITRWEDPNKFVVQLCDHSHASALAAVHCAERWARRANGDRRSKPRRAVPPV